MNSYAFFAPCLRLVLVTFLTPFLADTYSDIYVFLGRRFEEFQAQRICQMFSPFEGDDSFILHVTFVPHQNHLSVVPGIRFDLGAPAEKKTRTYVVYPKLRT